ncbi:MAG: hypothetical protein J5826_06430 [Bacteroidales bacterium]|nr:hypothetical protein [Bacteroidales bacterium]
MNTRRFAVIFSILSLLALCYCKGTSPRGGGNSDKKSYALSADSADRPTDAALLKLLYTGESEAKLELCKPILVDGQKYYFVRASHGFFNDGTYYYGFIDHHFVTTEGGALKADYTIKDTDTTFYGNEIEFESNSMEYSLVAVGKESVALKAISRATNQGFMEDFTLFLVETDRITQIFSIESSFDNAMWFPDNPTVYSNDVEIIDNKQDMYELLVTHKEYQVLFKGEDLDYDTKVSQQNEIHYVYSPEEIKFVEK